MNAYRKGFKGISESLKGKESLSDYQNKAKETKLSPTIEELRESILKL